MSTREAHNVFLALTFEQPYVRQTVAYKGDKTDFLREHSVGQHFCLQWELEIRHGYKMLSLLATSIDTDN